MAFATEGFQDFWCIEIGSTAANIFSRWRGGTCDHVAKLRWIMAPAPASASASLCVSSEAAPVRESDTSGSWPSFSLLDDEALDFELRLRFVPCDTHNPKDLKCCFTALTAAGFAFIDAQACTKLARVLISFALRVRRLARCAAVSFCGGIVRRRITAARTRYGIQRPCALSQAARG